MLSREDTINKLKIVKEDLAIIHGMYNKLDLYKKNIIEAETNINALLFDLTGDKFYCKEVK